VRRTSIEAGRYKAGWTRLSAGGMKRRVKVLAAGTGTGSRGRGASSGAAGDGDAWGPDDHFADAPPLRFEEGGLVGQNRNLNGIRRPDTRPAIRKIPKRSLGVARLGGAMWVWCTRGWDKNS